MTTAARFAKNQCTKVQTLPADVVAALRDYLPGKTAGAPVWGGTWRGKAAEMLRADLEAVGILYAVEGPDGPEHTDFHALRHSYLTMLGRNGVDLRTAQELAGHSTPTLTARYTHIRQKDAAEAVGKLPALVPADEPNRSTTTTGAGVPPGVSGDIPMHPLALIGGLMGRAVICRKPKKCKGPALLSTNPHRTASK